MYKFEELLQCQNNKVLLNGIWVPARPINSTKEYKGFFSRIRDAWLVFTCKADAFIWPENQ